MRKQEPQQRLALGFRHVHDMTQEGLTHEQCLPSTHGMGANQGVDYGRVPLHGVLPEGRGVSSTGVVVAGYGESLDEAVLRVEPEEEFLQNCWFSGKYLQRLRESFVGCDAAGEEGIPSYGRDELAAEDAAQGRSLDEGDIRVPAVVVRRMVSVGLEDHDFLKLGPVVRVEGMDV